MWCLCQVDAWESTPWPSVDTFAIEGGVTSLRKELRSLDKQVRPWPVFDAAEAKLDTLQASLPLLQALGSKDMRPRHWALLIQETVGGGGSASVANASGSARPGSARGVAGSAPQLRVPVDDLGGPATVLGDYMRLGLHAFVDEVQRCVDRASKELQMERTLRSLASTWAGMQFTFGRHQERDIPVLMPADAVREALDDSMVQLQSIAGSRFVAHFQEEVTAWQQRLSLVDAVLTLWFDVQKMWSYLEAIFIGSKDIRRALPEECKRFDSLDADLKELMKDVEVTPNVVECCGRPGMLDTLDGLMASLHVCEKALDQYLESKRALFPRFYFVAPADLLDILSKGHDPRSVAPHFPKIFEGIHSLQFAGDNAAPTTVEPTGKAPEAIGNWRSSSTLSVSSTAGGPGTPRGKARMSSVAPNKAAAAFAAAAVADARPVRRSNVAQKASTGPAGAKKGAGAEAVALVSREGEVVPLAYGTCECSGNAEQWLSRLIACMRANLKGYLASALNGYAEELRHKWLLAHTAQVVLVVCQLWWALEVDGAFERLLDGQDAALKDYHRKQEEQLAELIRLIQGMSLEAGQRQKVMTLVTMDVHARDVVERLLRDKVEDPESFAWQSQLRAQWREGQLSPATLTGGAGSKPGAASVQPAGASEDGKDCYVLCCDAEFRYQYEYLGNAPRLVVTALTDRCYITLTQALRLIMGGAPMGPAGTGKTETTKDLGRALGVMVYVFNCSDQMDYRSLGQIFKGLAQSGTWGCFDEFNRISVEVLSVVSTQFKSILDAIRQGRAKFVFQGEMLSLVPTCGAFITMNPGYAGRTELPESLKTLFRPVSMVVPDLGLICENMLLAAGFLTARPLSNKFITLYRLSKDLLSRQDHYEWGLRPIKSVLVVAASLKQRAIASASIAPPAVAPPAKGATAAAAGGADKAALFAEAEPVAPPSSATSRSGGTRLSGGALPPGPRSLKMAKAVGGFSPKDEAALLMRALRDFNLPQIVTEDVAVFLGLVGDLFPGVEASRSVDVALDKSVREVAVARGLQPEDSFILKVEQLDELLQVRHCVFIVGACGTGKSAVWRTLADVNTARGRRCLTPDLNPKAVSSDELYGHVSPTTREWKDGLLSALFRDLASGTTDDPKWLVLDGDVDPEWIESLNTVMDDNKVLTLASGERIPLKPCMRLLFEVAHLRSATPATVSRGGVLYLNEGDISASAVVLSWLETRPDKKERAILQGLFDQYVAPTLEFCACTPPGSSATAGRHTSAGGGALGVEGAAGHLSYITHVSDASKLQTVVRLLDGLLAHGGVPREADKDVLEAYFMVALVWGVGGALAADDPRPREAFSSWFRAQWRSEASPAARFPDSGTVFDYFVDPSQEERLFVPWEDLAANRGRGLIGSGAALGLGQLRGGTPEPGASFQSLVVTTVDSLRMGHLGGALLRSGHALLLVGGAGCGKTTHARCMLADLPLDRFDALTVNMHYYSDSAALQVLLEKPLEKKAGRVYAPPASKRLVYFVDDLNMPCVDKYGTQSAAELMLQHLGYAHWYDRSTRALKSVLKTQYMAAMNPQAGSFRINPRLEGKFCVFAVGMPPPASLGAIFTRLLDRWAEGVTSASAKELIPKLIAVTLEFHAQLAGELLPTSRRFHYIFTLREMATAFQGVALCPPGAVVSTHKLMRLWAHEIKRTYSDRLVDDGDLARAGRMLEMAATRTLEGAVDVRKAVAEPLLFAPFAGGVGPEDPAVYDDVVEAVRNMPAPPPPLPATHATSKGSSGSHAPPGGKGGKGGRKEHREGKVASGGDTGGGGKGAGMPHGGESQQAGSHGDLLLDKSKSSRASGRGTPSGTQTPVAVEDSSGVADEGVPLGRLTRLLTSALASYNESSHMSLHLVLFEDAMRHVCRISRVLAMPGGGHALLVGVGGSGKQSLCRLAAHIRGLEVVTITVTEGYGLAAFQQDLKAFFLKAGVRNCGLVLLLHDAKLSDERFLVPLSELLAPGDLPEVFTAEEREEVVAALRPEAKALGILETREACLGLFAERVRSNLRLVLAFSPAGDTLRVQCRRFPSLLKHTLVDWFHPWPTAALESVASTMLRDTPLRDRAGRDHSPALVSFLAFVHESVEPHAAAFLEAEGRFTATTPESFLELLRLYNGRLAAGRERVGDKQRRLEIGLVKLRETAAMIERLREELAERSAVVVEKQQRASAFLAELVREQAIVEAEVAKANEEEAVCNEIADAVREKQQECAGELEKAEPAVEAAVSALANIDKNSLVELKSFKKPAHEVRRVMEAVVLLLLGAALPGGAKDVSWVAAQKVMGVIERFLSQLQGYKALIDADQVPARVFQSVRPYVDDPKFNGTYLLHKSRAAANLCEWVRNIVAYYFIYVDVKPKREALEAANEKLKAANTKLTHAQAAVATLRSKLKALAAECDAASEEKRCAEAEAETARVRFDLALRLLRGLGSEGVRWESEMKRYEATRHTLPGDLALSVSFVTYAGSFTASFRDTIWRRTWLPALLASGIPCSSGAELDPVTVLADAAQIAAWSNQGLPSDRLSVENGVIFCACERWPLLIDPELQGLTWVTRHLESAGLKVATLQQRGFVKVLQHAVESGTPLLVRDVRQNLDPMLEPVLGRKLVRRGGQQLVLIGDREVPFHPRFRLVLQSEEANPHFRPEVQAQATLLNFSVTEAGLEQQLMGLVVRAQRPDLERRKGQLVQAQNEFKIRLKAVEDGVVEQLSSAEGDYLADTALVESLETMKATAADMHARVQEAVLAEAEVNRVREAYRPVGVVGSCMYFLLRDLAKVHVTYQFSLAVFVSVVIERSAAVTSAPASQRQGGSKGVLAGRVPGTAGAQGGLGGAGSGDSAPGSRDVTIRATGGERDAAAREGGDAVPSGAALPAVPSASSRLSSSRGASFSSASPGAPTGGAPTQEHAPSSLAASSSKGSLLGSINESREGGGSFHERSRESASGSPGLGGTAGAGALTDSDGPGAAGGGKSVQELVQNVLWNTFCYASPGLFEAHKLVFVTQMLLRMMVVAREWRAPRQGGGAAGPLQGGAAAPSGATGEETDELGAGDVRTHPPRGGHGVSSGAIKKGLGKPGAGGGAAAPGGPEDGGHGGVIWEDLDPLDPAELHYLLRRPLKAIAGDVMAGLEWMRPDVWQTLAALHELSPAFETLLTDMAGASKRWRDWSDALAPERERLPQDWKQVSRVQQLCILRAIRPDRMAHALASYVGDVLGHRFMSPQPLDLASVVLRGHGAGNGDDGADVATRGGGHSRDRRPPFCAPILFVLSPGTDPVQRVEAVARQVGGILDEGLFENVSLGQGQEPVAERALDRARREGGWVFLQNLHLMPRWLPRLEAKLAEMREGGGARGGGGAAGGQLGGSRDSMGTGGGIMSSSASGGGYHGATHPNCRVFLSAAPPPDPKGASVLPISLLQNCVRVTMEAPRDLRTNLKAAFAQLPAEPFDAHPRPGDLRVTSFALCYLHAVLMGRHKFGPAGWSRHYPFNTGDLLACFTVLGNYLEHASRDVPWSALRYMFGDVMYGGHITDNWDRRTASAYLSVLLRDDLVTDKSFQLAPGLALPPPQVLGADTAEGFVVGTLRHVDQSLANELPGLFHLAPNAEMGFLLATSNALFSTILAMAPKPKGGAAATGKAGASGASGTITSPRGVPAGALVDGSSPFPSSSSSWGSGSKEDGLSNLVSDLLDALPDLVDLPSGADASGGGGAGGGSSSSLGPSAVTAAGAKKMSSWDPSAPLLVVLAQECARLNMMLAAVRADLLELQQGLRGELTLSESVDSLMASLGADAVPPHWAKLSMASAMSLAAWFQDLLARARFLAGWSAEAVAGGGALPRCVWLAGLMNPQAFLTAVVQITARRNEWPLDALVVITEVTKKSAEEVDAAPREGAYIHGLHLDGARWDARYNTLAECGPKELPAAMPVMFVRAVAADTKAKGEVYECPVFGSHLRGPSYVFTATLKTAENPAKWVLAGVALLLGLPR
eukprot:jgi/Mesvir1/27110/Mv25131-RA.3